MVPSVAAQSPSTRFIGIDCATKPQNIGIALATLAHGNTLVSILKLEAGTKDPWDTVVEWIQEPGARSVLIAIDAPLGWPQPLAEALQGHTAGALVGECSNALVRRLS